MIQIYTRTLNLYQNYQYYIVSMFILILYDVSENLSITTNQIQHSSH